MSLFEIHVLAVGLHGMRRAALGLEENIYERKKRGDLTWRLLGAGENGVTAMYG